MTTHRALNLALAILIAAVATLGPALMDGPTDLDAIQATQASVLDAQAAAAAAAHTNQIAQVQP